MKEDILYENEMDMPEDWLSDIILERDGKGNIIEHIIPDDEEE